MKESGDDLMLTTFSFHSGQLPGNCGVRQAYRLKATYRSREEMEELMNSAAAQRELRQCLLSGTRGKFIVTLIDHFINCRADEREGRAIPLEWAYLYTLEKIHGGSYALICLSDTDNGQGDGHGGAFSTRGFAEWIVQRGLGEAVKCQNIRKDCDYDIMGYWIIPDHMAMDKALEEGLKEMRKRIREWNNDPRVKRSVEPVDEELERQLKQDLIRTWTETTGGFDDDGVDDEWEEFIDEEEQYEPEPF